MKSLYESIYNDNIWVSFKSDEGTLKVYPRCTCGKYLKHGKVTAGLKFTGWICKKHGEVNPFHLID
jgi:hypothetical protein